MADYDRGIKAVAHVAGRQLARLAGVECQEWAPLESTLQATTERLADRVFLARQGRERFVVYMEFYTYWKEEALWDVLEKAGMLSKREQLPTVCLLFVLRPKGYRPHNGRLRLTVGGQPTQQLWFHEVPLWEREPQEWWELIPPLMTLYPLCHHALSPRDAVRHAAAVIETQEPAVAERSELLTILGVFGKLAYPRLDVWAVIGREKMRESKFFQELEEEVALVRDRKAILRVLRARFRAEPPADVVQALEALDDLNRLGSLLDLAATCSSLNQFRKKVPGANGGH